MVIEQDGIKVCLHNYVTADTNPSLPINANVYLNWFEEQKVYDDIIKYKNLYDYVVLLLHWGGRVEGGAFPDINQPVQAKDCWMLEQILLLDIIHIRYSR